MTDQKMSRTEKVAVLQKNQRSKEKRQRNLIIGFVVAVVALLVVGVGYGLSSKQDISTVKAKNTPAHITKNYGVLTGKKDAPVKVVAYEDFQCPACLQFEKLHYDDLREKVSAGDISIEYRMIAFLDQASTTKYSTRAENAYAVVLDAYGPDVATKFHHILYENQPEEGSAGLTDQKLIDLAVQAGADKNKISAGIENQEFEQWVANATDASSKAGINQTPTVIVDGKTLKDPYTEVDTAISDATPSNQN